MSTDVCGGYVIGLVLLKSSSGCANDIILTFWIEILVFGGITLCDHISNRKYHTSNVRIFDFCSQSLDIYIKVTGTWPYDVTFLEHGSMMSCVRNNVRFISNDDVASNNNIFPKK
jgi:hypothetical protein